MRNVKWISVLSVSAVLSLTGCGSEPEWVSIYNECQDSVNKGLDEMKQSPDTPKAMGDMMESMGLAACEMIKTSCEKAPEGTMCQAIVNSHKEEK
ncbi:MAG: hypothetical protein KZQ70_08130 [gamma proteobacterium symbiont of Lucinoma myriamae]|nr:hypothetical protein [gamma proteobacterium symbiont of Lucinoma myriamae]MCU7819106.1 hypothetical protein [gamma proteobacterium symbiont of Lucinoma myriamae]MCU7832501.1 hypothetical protein [gamma proteobacterium symbiont of Lucinoma myriamae]